MRALVFDGQNVRLDENYPRPQPGRGEALVKVTLAGVCRTDLEILRGYMGFRGVLGHEFVGRVVEGPDAWKNARVVGEINCICGTCDLCRRGLSNHCPNRTVVGIEGHDGVFADYVALPVRNLHRVPDGVSDEHAALIEPLAAAMQIPRQVPIRSGDSVVVLGDGRLGQLAARVLALHARPLLIGRHRAKLDAAAKAGISTGEESEFTPTGETDLVVDATGAAEGFSLAMRTVRPRGTLVLKSTFAAESGMNPTPLVVNEVTVIGSRCGPFPDAVEALAGGAVDVSALISARYPLGKGVEALQAAGAPDALKVLLDVD